MYVCVVLIAESEDIDDAQVKKNDFWALPAVRLFKNKFSRSLALSLSRARALFLSLSLSLSLSLFSLSLSLSLSLCLSLSENVTNKQKKGRQSRRSSCNPPPVIRQL
jgi:hypothetical protein